MPNLSHRNFQSTQNILHTKGYHHNEGAPAPHDIEALFGSDFMKEVDAGVEEAKKLGTEHKLGLGEEIELAADMTPINEELQRKADEENKKRAEQKSQRSAEQAEFNKAILKRDGQQMQQLRDKIANYPPSPKGGPTGGSPLPYGDLGLPPSTKEFQTQKAEAASRAAQMARDGFERASEADIATFGTDVQLPPRTWEGNAPPLVRGIGASERGSRLRARGVEAKNLTETASFYKNAGASTDFGQQAIERATQDVSQRGDANAFQTTPEPPKKKGFLARLFRR